MAQLRKVERDLVIGQKAIIFTSLECSLAEEDVAVS